MAKINSNSNNAKKIIRNEIKSSYTKKTLKDEVKGLIGWGGVYTPYQAAAKMVDGGCYGAYYSDTDKMLGKIYGKKNVARWSNEKKWSTYKHLIARETDSIIRTNRITVGKRK